MHIFQKQAKPQALNMLFSNLFKYNFFSPSKWSDVSSLFETIFLLLTLIWTILFIFLLCEPGEQMTNQLTVFSDELSQCDWQLLSIKMQRMYAIFLLDTQNPMKMMSYANITCERETFKEVLIFIVDDSIMIPFKFAFFFNLQIIKTAFSYFLTMRRFRA